MIDVIISDLHLDAVTDGVPRLGDVLDALDQVKLFMDSSEDIEHVQVLGDVADPGDRSHQAVALFFNWLDLVSDRSSEASNILTGNHDVIESVDYSSTLDVLRFVNGGTYLSMEPVVDVTSKVAFLPYAPRRHAYDPEQFVRDNKDEEVELVLGHLNLEGIGPGSETTDMARGREVFWPLEAIAECWPNAKLVGGHYHKAQDYRYKGSLVHIVGAPVLFTHGEEGNKPSFTIYDRETKELSRVPFENVRPLVTITDRNADMVPPADAIVRVKVYDFDRRLKVCEALDKQGRSYVLTPVAVTAAPEAELPEEQGLSVEEQARESAIKMAREWPAHEQVFRDELAEIVRRTGTGSVS